MNIFENPNIDLSTLQDIILEKYLTGPNGADATDEKIEALMQWVGERYVAGHILDMVTRNVLFVNVDDQGEPRFTNTPEADQWLDSQDLKPKRPSLTIVK